MNFKKRNIVKSTKSGRLYIETTDFLNQSKVKATIELLLKSDLIREIEKKHKVEQKVHA